MARKANRDNLSGNGHANGNGHEPDDATMEASVEQRRDAIVQGIQQAYALQQKAKAALEKHVAPHRAGIADIKSNLREKFNITAPQFNARFALYCVERQAEEAGDDVTLDVMREMFEYLPAGRTLDLVEAAEEAERRQPRAPRTNGRTNGHAEDRPSA